MMVEVIKVERGVNNSKQITTSFLLVMTSLVEPVIAETTHKNSRHHAVSAAVKRRRKAKGCGDPSAMENIIKVEKGVRNSKQSTMSLLLPPSLNCGGHGT